MQGPEHGIRGNFRLWKPLPGNVIGDSSLCVIAICKANVRVVIHLWLLLFPIFVFAAQPKEFFLDGLKKLEQRSHECVELRGEYVE
jgi:hypothetical protein